MHAVTDKPDTIQQATIPLWRSLLPLGLGLIIIALCVIPGRPSANSEPGVVMTLPYKTGIYWGKREEPSIAEKSILPPDTEIERKVYSNIQGENIQCTIVLSGVERRSIHRPEVCLPGQGWTIASHKVVPVQLASGKTLYVKQLTLQREIAIGPGQTQKIQSLFYYWFVGKNTTTPEHTYRALHSAWDLIIHSINHRWAYVSVTSLVTDTIRRDGKNLAETETMLQQFIRDIVPNFQISEMPAGTAPQATP